MAASPNCSLSSSPEDLFYDSICDDITSDIEFSTPPTSGATTALILVEDLNATSCFVPHPSAIFASCMQSPPLSFSDLLDMTFRRSSLLNAIRDVCHHDLSLLSDESLMPTVAAQRLQHPVPLSSPLDES